ncbi:hypothetical protein HK103_005816 [Boothiomyces macroporosus]|uniref:Uncharacterized protein n=1 Tax=Boothiomyces macroporosus TaxID=261099 RepID=A0AAD5Y7J9_9FUNG|nr:hypothetical protein HK103_005816 [Boothiomyces macroporosus]
MSEVGQKPRDTRESTPQKGTSAITKAKRLGLDPPQRVTPKEQKAAEESKSDYKFAKPKPAWDSSVPPPVEKSRTNLTPHPTRVAGNVNQLRGTTPDKLSFKKRFDSLTLGHSPVAAEKEDRNYKALYYAERQKVEKLRVARN